ncbi:Hypp9212 [Branchiostoma lanceolatum]|uniref:Hypp9212 protein n=1 Tax=Branchiostoma lanceolatum TaxID=7740 RepID=A0A8K0EKY6_BRALA|nr:Hypp9212 [Branchiostoma lanceolatum]
MDGEKKSRKTTVPRTERACDRDPERWIPQPDVSNFQQVGPYRGDSRAHMGPIHTDLPMDRTTDKLRQKTLNRNPGPSQQISWYGTLPETIPRIDGVSGGVAAE